MAATETTRATRATWVATGWRPAALLLAKAILPPRTARWDWLATACTLAALLVGAGCSRPPPVPGTAGRPGSPGADRVCGMRLTGTDGVRLIAAGPVPRLLVERQPATFRLDNSDGTAACRCTLDLQAKGLAAEDVFFMRGPFDRARSVLRQAGPGRVQVGLPVAAGSRGMVCIEPRVQAPADPSRWSRDGLAGAVEQGAYLGRRRQATWIRSLGPATRVLLANRSDRRRSFALRLANVSTRLSVPRVEGAGSEGSVIEPAGPLGLRVRGALDAGESMRLKLMRRRLSVPHAVLVGGDMKCRLDVFLRLVEAARRRAEPAYMVAVGDYSEMGLGEEVRAFVQATASLGFPVYHVKGNHEVHCQGDAHYARTFGTARYHFVAGGLLWVILDSNGWDPDGFRLGNEQLTWLERVLQEHEEVPWKMVVLHAPPHPLHGPSGDPDYPANLHPDDAARLKRIAAARGVAYVLSGHAHLYARKQEHGVIYLTSGGGGARLGAYNPLPGFRIDERKHLVLLHVGPEGIEEEVVGIDRP